MVEVKLTGISNTCWTLRSFVANIRMQAEALVPQPAYGYHTSNQSNTTHEITQQISRKLLRMDVLTSETC